MRTVYAVKINTDWFDGVHEGDIILNPKGGVFFLDSEFAHRMKEAIERDLKKIDSNAIVTVVEFHDNVV